MNRYLTLIVPAFVVLLIVIGFIILFTGGGEESPTNQPKVLPLPEYYDTNADVSLTTRGRVTGDDTHSSIRITVDQFQRRLDILGGYNNNIVQTETFTNNQQAYKAFLYAINDAGFMIPKSGVSEAAAQPLGKCPLGNQYIFELNDGGEELSGLWASNCKKMGTLGGNYSTLRKLFQAQITDYNKLVSDVDL